LEKVSPSLFKLHSSEPFDESYLKIPSQSNSMAIKITITGKVHDVGYRAFLLEEADSLLIPCFEARNVKIDGKEALIVLADGEKEQLESFIRFVKENWPQNAVVESIKVEEYYGRVRDIEKYRASFNTTQLSKIIQVGLVMVGRQDLMLQKQDETLSKIDLMLQKQDGMLSKMDLMLQKQDLMLQKQDETILAIREVKKSVDEVKGGVKEVSSKIDRTNELLEKRFQRLEEEVEKIKKALLRAGIEI